MDENKLLLLSIQQTLDENAEKLLKIEKSKTKNNESLKLDVNPINEVLNEHFSKMATLLENHLKKIDEFSNSTTSEPSEPTHIITKKHFSLIGVSPYSRFTIQKIIIFISMLIFLFFTAWIGLEYWFTKGYKIRNQNTAYKTIELIKKSNKNKYSKKDILKIYESINPKKDKK